MQPVRRSDVRRPLTIFSLWPIILNPKYILMPIDHRMEIKGAVGAARGSSEQKRLQTHALDQWVLVGTLSLAVVAALLALVSGIPADQVVAV